MGQHCGAVVGVTPADLTRENLLIFKTHLNFFIVKRLGLGLGLGLGTGIGDWDWGMRNWEWGMGKWEMGK